MEKKTNFQQGPNAYWQPPQGPQGPYYGPPWGFQGPWGWWHGQTQTEQKRSDDSVEGGEKHDGTPPRPEHGYQTPQGSYPYPQTAPWGWNYPPGMNWAHWNQPTSGWWNWDINPAWRMEMPYMYNYYTPNCYQNMNPQYQMPYTYPTPYNYNAPYTYGTPYNYGMPYNYNTPYYYNTPHGYQSPTTWYNHPNWNYWGTWNYDYANWNRPGFEHFPKYNQYYNWMYNRSYLGGNYPYSYNRYGTQDPWGPGYNYTPHTWFSYGGPRWWSEYRPIPGQEFMVAA